ncbi:hypothetical protein KEM60_02175 [Austwickia sp. TVS 96-490-7B]|uniref:precorrin-6A synthase (deacetylating) n=1 Tax=Austwickia sp. TVS 96-490-7B TaxID=2830843 RepID=UPI001C59F34E|nr:precorrin-6A synthase (deacetylating) [Austwickia sp. TVS 96-490-7B]MBW3085964.1 hypothetical protein [Austwickia sp. TVS 96-490-7B]
MPREILVVGIATGTLEHLTLEAVDALRRIDVVLVADKRQDTADLTAWRSDVCARVRDDDGPRVIAVPDPDRGPDATRDATAYATGVRDWHRARVDAYEAVLRDLPEDDVIGFLVWGDPAYYDSTLRIVDALAERISLDCHVIPGIGAVSLLAARHRIHLNRIGHPVHITTGRRLLQEYAAHGADLGDIVVMLDGYLRCTELAATHPDLWIYWGAYLGSEREELRSGRLGDLADELRTLRAALKESHGWVMDTYLLRHP